MTTTGRTSNRTSNRPVPPSRWLGCVALPCLLLLGACGIEQPPAFLIVGNTIPDDSCTVKAQGGAQSAFRAFGTLDLSIGDSYVAFLMVNNQFPQFESALEFQPDSLRLEPGDITIDGVQVTLQMDYATLVADLDAAQLTTMNDEWTALGLASQFQALASATPLFYERYASGSVQVGATGVAIADIIPPHIGRALRAFPQLVDTSEGPAEIEAVAEVHVVGRRQDGKLVKSGLFRFPITFCNNCLVAPIYPQAIAINPFNPSAGDPLSVDVALGSLSTGSQPCTAGADDVVTNAFCGALWAPGSCQQTRCLGGDVGDTLNCDGDGLFIPAQGLGQ